jgi:hypothetical protein
MNKMLITGGIDLPPLPYESSRSILARLGWRNGVKMNEILSAWRREQNGAEVNFIRSELYDLTGKWLLTMNAERLFNLNIRIQADQWRWYEAKFRFCPLCLEECYHSYLFQWRRLLICPRHGCTLASQCQCCGKEVDKSSYSPDARAGIGKMGYRCSSCFGPIAGAVPDLQSHLQLQTDSAYLAERMGPIEQEFYLLLERMSHVSIPGAYPRAQLRRHVVDATERLMRKGALPRGLTRSFGMTYVRWSSRMAEASGSANLVVPESPQTPAKYHAVYVATRRLLARWVFQRDCIEEEDSRVCRLFVERDEDSLVDEWPALELSYVIFCSRMESLRILPITSHRFFVLAPLPYPLQRMEEINRLPRVAYRAWLLHSFSVIYTHLSTMRGMSVCKASRMLCVPESHRPMHQIFGGEADSGALCFPTVVGMPTSPFKRRHL